MAIKKIFSTNRFLLWVIQFNTICHLVAFLCQPSTAALYTVRVSLLVPSNLLRLFLPQVVPSHSGPAKKSHSLLSASFLKNLSLHFISVCPTFFYASAWHCWSSKSVCCKWDFQRTTCSPPSPIQESLSNFCIYNESSQRTCFKQSIPLILTRHLLRSILWLLEQSEMLYYMLLPTFAFQTQCS